MTAQLKVNIIIRESVRGNSKAAANFAATDFPYCANYAYIIPVVRWRQTNNEPLLLLLMGQRMNKGILAPTQTVLCRPHPHRAQLPLHISWDLAPYGQF